MSYTVLARRYRSQTFEEVVGQSAVAKTLANAIRQGRVAHAYLFVGTRGVGKTSMARIFAKALAGGSPEADRAIMTGQDTDVIEIDAASNNSVENARELIASSIYRPMRGTYKVYIIDEVHMLSTSAFNALLKTMEEPPEHVKFILCTTEAQKVPATIQSRCQRFDFRNLTAREVAEHLRAVVEREQVKADPDLLFLLGKLAAGSMRDALSLMDRLLAASAPGEPIGVSLLESLLGLPERALLSQLMEALGRSDAASALTSADALLARGTGIDQLIESITEYLRDLMLLCVCGPETPLVEASEATRQTLAAQSQLFDAPALVHMIALCDSVQRSSKQSVSPRAVLDALLVRLAMTDRIAQIMGSMGTARAALPAARPAASTPAGKSTPAPRPPTPSWSGPEKKA